MKEQKENVLKNCSYALKICVNGCLCLILGNKTYLNWCLYQLTSTCRHKKQAKLLCSCDAVLTNNIPLWTHSESVAGVYCNPS